MFPMKKNVLRAVAKAGAIAFIMGIAVYFSVSKERKWQSGSLNFTTMSTWATVWLYSDDLKDDMSKGFTAVRNAFADVEKTCGIYDPSSELARLNASAADKPFVCSDMLWDVLNEARRFNTLSNGCFDVTLGPVTALWKRKGTEKIMPGNDELANASALTGFDKIVFNDKDKSVSFKVRGMSIDLGGIAKGYALDLAKQRLADAGYTRGYIDLGGNVITLAEPPPKTGKYSAGVKNPYDRNVVCGSAEMLDEAVSTSGNYERYVTIDGHNYTHIIDPRTARPVEEMLSVSVITARGIDSDALSTAIFVGGEKTARELTKTFPDMRVLLFRRENGKTVSFTVGEWQYFIAE